MLCVAQYLPVNFCLSNVRLPLASILVPKYGPQRQNAVHYKSKTRLKLCCCSSNENQQQLLKDFSLLECDSPWESGNVWTTMALYFFSLHIPMSFGGLSVVAQMLHQPSLDPQVKAVAILVIETLELFGALLLLEIIAKPDYKPVDFLKPNELQSERNWVLAAILGLIFLVIAIFLTSLVANRLGGAEGVNNLAVKEILSSSIVSQTACTLVYCIVAPLLEEIVYRRFLLTSLAPSMQWPQAVIISSVIFSAAHLSGENFLQLFIIGLALGCSYCWTGDLRSSILLHSAYNALTLLIAFFT